MELTADIGDRVFFSRGSAELGSRARSMLAAQAAWLRRNDAVGVVIEGHADGEEIAAGHADLSLQRAQIIRAALATEGIAPDRLKVLAVGDARPIATCVEAFCAAQNRRVVVRVDDGDARPRRPRLCDAFTASGPRR